MMTKETALAKAQELCKTGSRRCTACGGKGYIEVHEPGHTHYETDSECPGYHFRRISCTCSRQNEIAAELMRAYGDGVAAGRGFYEPLVERERIRAEADALERGEG